MLKYGSVCSGIEAASVAWRPLGWRASFLSEIEPFPRAMLAHHYPGVPLHGDFTTIEAGRYEPIDLLVGGTPCQSFSVAGLRGGLDDDRGNLALEYCRLARRLRPRWVVWENVPGVLSLDEGRAFASILGGLAECGYGLCFRVLDAQYCRVDGFPGAVPQRRQRVFVVGYLGDWRRAAAVLLEPEGMRGDPAPRRGSGEGIAAGTLRSSDGGSDVDRGLAGHLIPLMAAIPFDTTQITSAANRSNPQPGAPCHPLTAGGHPPAVAWPASVAPTLNASFGDKWGLEDQHALGGAGLFVAHSLRAEGFDASEDGTGRGTPIVPVAFGAQNSASQGPSASTEISPTLDKSKIVGLHTNHGVRRLTPTECERLQGFPDGYTAILYRGRPAADGPRYKALGNSMAVNVMRWIGLRIAACEAVTELRRTAA